MAKQKQESVASIDEEIQALQTKREVVESQEADALVAQVESAEEQMEALDAQRQEALGALDALGYEMTTPRGPKAGKSKAKGQKGRVRPVNKQPLAVFMVNVLKKHTDGMTIGQLSEAVQKAGYNTNSANFKANVAQALGSKEGKKLFTKKERGVYAAK